MPTASARCCPAICAAAPATSRSSRPCSTPAPPTRSRRHDPHREGRGVKNTFIGSPVERREDLRFVRGRGQYVDDLHPDGLLYAVILRSSVAHGLIRSIDVSAALNQKGVRAVITAEDLPAGPPKIP